MRFSILADDYNNPRERFMGDMNLEMASCDVVTTAKEILEKQFVLSSSWYIKMCSSFEKYERSKRIRFTNLAEKKD